MDLGPWHGGVDRARDRGEEAHREQERKHELQGQRSAERRDTHPRTIGHGSSEYTDSSQ